jgi:DNA-binding PadR family transcriptional regulator
VSPEQELLRGPGLAAVLKLLEQAPQSGYELAAGLRDGCPEALSQGDASLYALLYFLEAQRLVEVRCIESGQGMRRTYALTEAGRQRLAHEGRQWQSLANLFGSPSAMAVGLHAGQPEVS